MITEYFAKAGWEIHLQGRRRVKNVGRTHMTSVHHEPITGSGAEPPAAFRGRVP